MYPHQKLNQNISGGSVFRNAYDQASNIMYRARGGGLEGLRESIDINGQPHNLAYINPTEANLLEVLGGSGQKVDGVPAYYGFGYSNGDTGEGIGGDDEGAATSYESASPAEQEAADLSSIAGALGPEGTGAGVFGQDVEGQKDWFADSGGQDILVGDPGEDRVKPVGPYDAQVAIKMSNNPEMTEAQALREAQVEWYHTEYKYGNTEMTDEEKESLAIDYGQEWDEEGKEAADLVLATKGGVDVRGLKWFKNTAVQAKEAAEKKAKDDLGKDFKNIGREWGGLPQEEMTEEEYVEMFEDNIDKAGKDAVINAFLESDPSATFQSKEDTIPSLQGTIYDMISGKQKFGMEGIVKGTLGSLTVPLGLRGVIGAANMLGKLMGETVLGTVTINGVDMLLHESGALTFASPEDEPGFDPSSIEGGDDSGLTSLKEERLPVKEEEEEEDKGTRSIADLVKRGSSGTGTDSLLKLYQSIYGPDANPFGQDNRN